MKYEGGHLIARIHQMSSRIFSRILKDRGMEELNPAQGRIMFVLWQKDEIAISELANCTSLSKSTLTSMLDRLAESGYIQRKASPSDRRKIILRRTEKDASFQKAYNEVSEEMVALFYDGFSEKEITDFESYLHRILRNLLDAI